MSDDDAAGIDAAGAPPWRRTRRLLLGVIAALIVVIAGVVWSSTRGDGAPSVHATVADCAAAARSAQSAAAGSAPLPAVHVVGAGPYASLAVVSRASGPWFCFDGLGTGEGRVPAAVMRAPVGVAVVLYDLHQSRDALVLVHHSPTTGEVIIDAARSRSTVLGTYDGFEVLEVPHVESTGWHVPWPSRAAVLGQVIGYDSRGLVTGSQPFAICPGDLDTLSGSC